jgi:hypothetical protein
MNDERAVIEGEADESGDTSSAEIPDKQKGN